MIVVLDTNVWVSGLEFGGTPGRAINKVLTRDFKVLTRDFPAISVFIQNEIVRTVTRKFGWEPAELRKLDELLAQALFAEVTGEVTGVCRDRKDDAILETAWKVGANLLVAGDKDLLSLGKFRGIPIITPAEYVKAK